MKLVYLVGSLACWMVASLMADDTQRTLFDFSGADSAKEWQTVNDGVMGGVSDGRFKITDAKTMEFFGTLHSFKVPRLPQEKSGGNLKLLNGCVAAQIMGIKPGHAPHRRPVQNRQPPRMQLDHAHGPHFLQRAIDMDRG